MKKSNLSYLPNFFDRYINLVSDDDLLETLEAYSPKKVFTEIDKLSVSGDYSYAEGKWTIKEILQHCIDTEQIMAYRAMSIARGEIVNLPGFDENAFVDNIEVSHQSVEELIGEYQSLRLFNLSMFSKIRSEKLLINGNANNTKISPLALGFVIVGHGIHHNNIINERYLNTL